MDAVTGDSESTMPMQPLKAITALELEQKVDEMGKRGCSFEVILIKNLLRTKGVEDLAQKCTKIT